MLNDIAMNPTFFYVRITFSNVQEKENTTSDRGFTRLEFMLFVHENMIEASFNV